MNLIGFYNYTVILTYLGAAAAICGIFFSTSGYPFWGIICLLFAGLTDMFDGKVASTMKRTDSEKAFGIQIDSLCDLISFGALPLAIGYGIGLSGGFFYASCVLYLLCAIIRLAYFNVDEAQRQKNETGKRKSYYGFAKDYPGNLGSNKYVIGDSLTVRRNETIRKIISAVLIVILFVVTFIATTVCLEISEKPKEKASYSEEYDAF